MTALHSDHSLYFTDSLFIARSPETLYDMVSDVTRMGEWSPVCRACWWDEGQGPAAGSWFTGRNETPDRVWETRSQVEVADPGKEFTFVVGHGWIRWSYTFLASGGGTELSETWDFLPAGLARFAERFGDGAAEQVAERSRAAQEGIPATLAAIKVAAEQAGNQQQ